MLLREYISLCLTKILMNLGQMINFTKNTA